MKSNISTKIKKREKPNDVFYTPIPLVETHLELVKKYVNDNDVVYDGFYGTGNYYNNYEKYFKNNTFEFSEIEMGKDFFKFDKHIDLIISNPPYSILDNVFEKSVELKPHTISYLIGINNLTAKRIEYMNSKGYYLDELHLCKVFKWYGMSCIIVFTNKVKKNKISYDRIIYK